MKTDILDIKRRSVTPGGIARLIAALATLPLCFTAACTAEPGEGDTASQTTTQALGGAGCTVHRPIGWSGAANVCLESRWHTAPLSLSDGQDYWFDSAPGPGLGEGVLHITCDNGVIVTDPWGLVCIPEQSGGGDDR